MFICKYCLLIQRCIRIDVLFIYLLLKCFKVMCTFRKIVQYMNANVNGLITIVILIHLSKIAIAWLLQQNDGVYCVVMQRMWNALKSSFLYSFSLKSFCDVCLSCCIWAYSAMYVSRHDCGLNNRYYVYMLLAMGAFRRCWYMLVYVSYQLVTFKTF